MWKITTISQSCRCEPSRAVQHPSAWASLSTSFNDGTLYLCFSPRNGGAKVYVCCFSVCTTKWCPFFPYRHCLHEVGDSVKRTLYSLVSLMSRAEVQAMLMALALAALCNRKRKLCLSVRTVCCVVCCCLMFNVHPITDYAVAHGSIWCIAVTTY